MPNEQKTCQDCGTQFEFTEGERVFYESKGFAPPKRCEPCRKRARADYASRQGGGGSGGHSKRDRKRRGEYHDTNGDDIGMDTGLDVGM